MKMNFFCEFQLIVDGRSSPAAQRPPSEIHHNLGSLYWTLNNNNYRCLMLLKHKWSWTKFNHLSSETNVSVTSCIPKLYWTGIKENLIQELKMKHEFWYRNRNISDDTQPLHVLTKSITSKTLDDLTREPWDPLAFVRVWSWWLSQQS